MRFVTFLYVRSCPTERGSGLARYAVILGLIGVAAFLAFTTVGQDVTDRIVALGRKIAEAQ